MRYDVVSDIRIQAVARDSGTDVDDYFLDDSCQDVEDDLINVIEGEMNGFGPGGLAPWIHVESLKPIVTNIVVTVKHGKAVTHVDTTRELTPIEQSDVIDYIVGQFSDGWGEGMEQRPFSAYMETFDEETEEEDEEGNLEPYYETVTETIELFAHFWNNRVSSSMRIEEIA